MPLFQQLLSRAFRLCNRVGVPLAVIVAVFGAAVVATQAGLWAKVRDGLMTETYKLTDFTNNQARVTTLKGIGSGEQATMLLLEDVNTHINKLPAELREQETIAFFTRAGKALAPTALPFLALLLLLRALSWTSLLSLAGRPTADVLAAFGKGARSFPVLAGTWAGAWLCAGAWLPLGVFLVGFVYRPVLVLALPSFIPLLILYPRFLLAPSIAAAEGKGIRESLHLAYARSRGKWLFIVLQMLGLGAVLWMASTVVSGFLNFLVSSVSQYSIAGFALYAVVPFLMLTLEAYRSAFTVELAAALKRSGDIQELPLPKLST